MTNPPVDFEPPTAPAGQSVPKYAQWEPPVAPPAPPVTPPVTLPPTPPTPVAPQWPAPAAAYSADGYRPPSQARANWLWALIVVFIVVAVVRFASTPSPPRALPTIPQMTTTLIPLPSTMPSDASQPEPFCLSYYVFSIDVTASWGVFGAAVSQGDVATATTLATQFYAEAQAMQQADPPDEVRAQIDTVVVLLMTSQNILSAGSVSGLPAVDGTWADITALQAAVEPVCR